MFFIRFFTACFLFSTLFAGGGMAFADERSDKAFQNPSAAPPPIPCASFLPGCKTVQTKELSDFRKNDLFSEVIPRFLKWAMSFTGAVAVLAGVVSGVMFVFGGQNEELLTKAKKAATYAVVGLLLAMFAFFIVEMINRVPFPGSAQQ